MPLDFDSDSALNLWIATGPTVAEALAHPQLRVRPPGEPVPAALVGTAAGDVFALLVRMTDGEFHARHKPAVRASAQRWSADEIAAAAGLAARDLWGRVAINDWLSQVPVQAMARLLGVPPAALDSTVDAVHRFTRAIGPGADVAAIAAAEDAVRLLMAQGEAEGLDRVQSANRIALMQQSLDATAGLIGNALVRWQEKKPAPITREFVAECARSHAAILNTRRFAAEDLSLGGKPVRAGQGIVLHLAEAALGFGAGVHQCPGEALAITLAAGALQAIDPATRDWTPTAYRPLPNARIPVFAESGVAR